MSTEQLTLDGAPGRRILRLYNLYRVIIGLALVLLISSDLDDQLLELAHAQLFRYGSWTYLILNVLVAVLLQRPSHLAQVFSLALLDVLLLCTLFFAAGGTPSGIGNLLIVAAAIGLVWRASSACSLLDTFMLADRRMYEHKRQSKQAVPSHNTPLGCPVA